MASAEKIYADLHVHTWYSDSSLSPENAVREAVRHGVGVLAIADHEGFEGSREAQPLALKYGIAFIPAAEMECTEGDAQLHILCYGADNNDPALSQMAKRGRFLLDDMTVRLIDKMRDDFPALSALDYQDFKYDRSLGGWKGLHYLMARGVTQTLKGGMPLYADYGVDYHDAGFPRFEKLIAAIHGAGGRAVLAHPGHTLRSLGLEGIRERVISLIDRGLDGIECYYPLHDIEITQMLRNMCEERSLLITAGSDCHGLFGRTRVGEMDVEAKLLRLDGLL